MTTSTTSERPQPFVTDKTGKRWEMVFTLNLIKPLAAALGHPPRDLLVEPEKLLAFLIDPEKVAAVAYLFTPPVPPAVPKASAEEFAAALDSEALDQASEVIIRLLADMYAPRGKKEQVADAIIDSLREAGAKAAESKRDEQTAEGPAPADATAA